MDKTFEVEKVKYSLTPKGINAIETFIKEANAKRKEILDAGIDTADETAVITLEAILADIEWFGLDNTGEEGELEYYNSWGVTDNYNTDYAICLRYGKEFI